MKKPIYVIGHKNPDTDSICSAIAYAYLKNHISEGNYIPKRAGEINDETKYVLEKFGIDEPGLIEDVGPQVSDIDFRRTEGILQHETLRNAWLKMKELGVVTLPVVMEDGRLKGLVTNGDISSSYMDVTDNYVLSRARTQYKNIIETINGTILAGNSHAYFTKGKVVVPGGNRDLMRREVEQDDLVILGNIPERQRIAIEEGASCVVVCGGGNVAKDIVEFAEENECILIVTDYDTFTVARIIHQSVPIEHVMTWWGLTSFELDESVEEVKLAMKKVRYRDFPIRGENWKYVGMLSRRNLMDLQRKQVILVDHNEKNQAVDGITEADVLEIIDHHRLGSLETLQPIFFRNMPVGSSGAIISAMFKENKVEIPKDIAGLLCSAIISDTLLFRSPTCTEFDKAEAEKLAEIAGIDMKPHALAMFEAGSNFGKKTPKEIFAQDFKVFNVGDISFGVSQVSSVSRRRLNAIKEGLCSILEDERVSNNLKMVYVLLTDIFDEDTEVLFNGSEAKEILLKAFDEEAYCEDTDSFVLKGVVSRKKQFAPPVIEAIQES